MKEKITVDAKIKAMEAEGGRGRPGGMRSTPFPWYYTILTVTR